MEPQLLVTVYEMGSVPALTPITTPPETVALELPALQVPPETVSVRVTDDPTHTLSTPEIEPASGNGLIVMLIVVPAVLQAFVTV